MPMTIDKAQVTTPSDREVKVARSFKAPRALVYRAYTEPKLLKRWLLGPPGWTLPVCEMDVRVGGKYRWQWRSDDGTQAFGFHGTFREVQPEARLVHSEAYDPGTMGGPYPGTEAIVTEDPEAARRFIERVDAAIVMHNTSTQFADGGEFGMGAEIGISTNRLPPRGPVGAEQLTTYKYVVRGSGQLRP